ncbi:MAG: hypothetical protein HGA87_01145 [Desulfobulbaceae bacterium]|nr:hypothetical protein [Desulfobulbaceae bacterium]
MRRIYHHWEKWECFKAGFYDKSPPDGISKEEALQMYADFLADSDRFKSAINEVFKHWPHSCEQFLTNPEINRVAWLGQASMCITTGVPSFFKSGFRLLSEKQQAVANKVSADAIQEWEQSRNEQMRLW